MTPRPPLRRAAAVAFAVAAVTATPSGAAAAAAPCPHAAVAVAPATAAKAATATLCLVNRQRAARGLVPLRRQADLSRAADAFAAQMVRERFFDHVAPDGSTLLARVRRTGYLDGTRGYDLGENIAWGTGRFGTPKSIVASWMRSPGHRANILQPAFRELGLGVARGNPEGRGGGATYVHVFGSRRR